jgi:hypothetical protein
LISDVYFCGTKEDWNHNIGLGELINLKMLIQLNHRFYRRFQIENSKATINLLFKLKYILVNSCSEGVTPFQDQLYLSRVQLFHLFDLLYRNVTKGTIFNMKFKNLGYKNDVCS